MQRTKIKFWAVSSVISFVALLLVMFLTTPVDKIGIAIVFFIILFLLLVSLGHLILYIRRGKVGSRGRTRILIISVFIVLLTMFRSVQSLSWIDALILLLVVGGLLFYSSRRVN